MLPPHTDAPIFLEAATRRLGALLGYSRSTLYKYGYVDRLKTLGLHGIRQHMLDGSVKLRGFRIRPSVVDALAADILKPMPTAETVARVSAGASAGAFVAH